MSGFEYNSILNQRSDTCLKHRWNFTSFPPKLLNYFKHTPTPGWSKTASNIFVLLFITPSTPPTPTHTLTPFSEFLAILSRVASLIPPHAQLILLTYPLTHTHPRQSVSAKTLVVKLATARRHHRCCCYCVQVQVRNHHNKRKRNKRNRNFAPAHKHSSASSRSSRKLVFSCFFFAHSWQH